MACSSHRLVDIWEWQEIWEFGKPEPVYYVCLNCGMVTGQPPDGPSDEEIEAAAESLKRMEEDLRGGL